MIPKILIADVQKEARELFSRILEEDGSVSCYTSGDIRSLLHQIEQTAFAIILIDVQIIFSKGFLLLKALQKLCPDTPILMVGYRSEIELMNRAKGFGVSGYILKPVTAKELRSIIHSHLPPEATKLENQKQCQLYRYKKNMRKEVNVMG